MYMQYHMQGYNDNDLHDLFLCTVRTFHPEVTQHHRTKLVTSQMRQSEAKRGRMKPNEAE